MASEPTELAPAELIDVINTLLAEIGALPVCEDWMYSSIRHCQRNMDFDVVDGFNEPDRQCGGSIGRLVNLAPQIVAALRKCAS